MDCPAILAQRVITVLTRPGCDLSRMECQEPKHGVLNSEAQMCPKSLDFLCFFCVVRCVAT